jgi:molybdopterin converting factor subunit 1
MQVEVKLFAAARQLAGADSLAFDLDEPTIGALRGALCDTHPAMASLVRRAMFAIDAEYAPDDASISPGAEVACIPPVSGG